MKILNVDDNLDSRMILGATLKSDGYAVTIAADGAEALRLAREAPPDILRVFCQDHGQHPRRQEPRVQR